MSQLHTDNKSGLSKSAPLFASSWLALFYILRENFNERQATTEPVDSAALINNEIAESTHAD